MLSSPKDMEKVFSTRYNSFAGIKNMPHVSTPVGAPTCRDIGNTDNNHYPFKYQVNSLSAGDVCAPSAGVAVSLSVIESDELRSEVHDELE